MLSSSLLFYLPLAVALESPVKEHNCAACVKEFQDNYDNALNPILKEVLDVRSRIAENPESSDPFALESMKKILKTYQTLLVFKDNREASLNFDCRASEGDCYVRHMRSWVDRRPEMFRSMKCASSCGPRPVLPPPTNSSGPIGVNVRFEGDIPGDIAPAKFDIIIRYGRMVSSRGENYGDIPIAYRLRCLNSVISWDSLNGQLDGDNDFFADIQEGLARKLLSKKVEIPTLEEIAPFASESCKKALFAVSTDKLSHVYAHRTIFFSSLIKVKLICGLPGPRYLSSVAKDFTSVGEAYKFLGVDPNTGTDPTSGRIADFDRVVRSFCDRKFEALVADAQSTYPVAVLERKSDDFSTIAKLGCSADRVVALTAHSKKDYDKSVWASDIHLKFLLPRLDKMSRLSSLEAICSMVEEMERRSGEKISFLSVKDVLEQARQ
jgi:hypothetical protein